jgi:hypothetical protein
MDRRTFYSISKVSEGECSDIQIKRLSWRRNKKERFTSLNFRKLNYRMTKMWKIEKVIKTKGKGQNTKMYVK